MDSNSKQDGGSIILTARGSGKKASWSLQPYRATKAALRSFVDGSRLTIRRVAGSANWPVIFGKPESQLSQLPTMRPPLSALS
jgi:NADP-dependent 3-hydroxy acid dehydrogenase YdfG